MRRKKFTVRFIESLKPDATPYEVADADVKGLLIRVQPSGVKSFPVQLGRGKRVTLPQHYPVCTIEAARTQAIEILRNPMAFAKRRTSTALVATTFDDYLTEHYGPWVTVERKAGKATLANLEAQFGPLFGGKPLTEVTAWNTEKFKAARLKGDKEKEIKPVKPATVNRDLDRLRAALNKAVEWGFLESNPIASVKRSKGGDSVRVRYLDEHEEPRLRKALLAREAHRRKQRASGNAWAAERGRELRKMWAADAYTDHLMPLTLLALNTGLRRGELFSLMWATIDLDRKQLTVAASTAKSGKLRHVPLNTEAVDVLKRWKKHHVGGELVFPSAGSRLTHINKSWKSLMKAAKLNDFRFHDCRHTLAAVEKLVARQ